nr:hypothetical transcript [Hymenolepis microstoma]
MVALAAHSNVKNSNPWTKAGLLLEFVDAILGLLEFVLEALDNHLTETLTPYVSSFWMQSLPAKDLEKSKFVELGQNRWR